jgi:hypothetical protein
MAAPRTRIVTRIVTRILLAALLLALPGCLVLTCRI